MVSKAVIAGGGLAGLACAKRLVDAGVQVELVEAESQFGGRAASWTDPTDGEKIESGIHSFLGAYDHLKTLLKEVGVEPDNIVTWDKKLGFLQPGPRYNMFGIDPLRDLPEVIAGVIGNNELINPLDKLTLVLSLLKGIILRQHYEPYTIAQLARDGNVTRNSFERIFRPLTRGLHFLEPEELTAYALMTLVSQILIRPTELLAGTFKGGMSDVMSNPIARWLERKGAIMRTDTPVQAINYSDRITGIEVAGGEILTGDVYVSALPLEVFKQLIPSQLEQIPYFANIKQIETVPAISVQLWFDRRFVETDKLIFVAESPMVIFQDESYVTFPSPNSHISCQIVDRATDGYTDQQYIDLALQQLHQYIPASADAQLHKSVVVRHQAIAMKPGTEKLRPEQTSPISNFYLCGDYTNQDWFTTMEGAVRSGEMAAERILRRR